MRSFDQTWEDNIYSKGEQLNRYPFGELVSYVLRLYALEIKSGKKLRALELGFGAGNNLAFLAKEGFETYGIEGSKSACDFAKSSFQGLGLTIEVVQGDFVNLPFPDGFFDLVIDREAVYANRKEAILKISTEVKRCLKEGGFFLSFAYSTEHFSATGDLARKIEPNTFSDFKAGPFHGAGVAHFFTQDEIVNEYFSGFEIEFLHHHRLDHVIPKKTNQYAEFIVCGRKPCQPRV